jgi:AraC family transcriptional regulator
MNNQQFDLPCLPILSSQDANWDNIQLAYFRQPAYRIPEHKSPQHVICMNAGKSVWLEKKIDGRFEADRTVPGDIDIYPAHLWLTASWLEEAEFLQLYLEPSFLEHVNYQLYGSDRVELVPQSLLDPLIQNIALALKTTLETNSFSSRLYADSMAQALVVHLLDRYSSQERTLTIYKKGLSKQHLQLTINYIQEHLDRDLSLAELASVAQLSSFHFARLFKQSTGYSPHQYHIQCRIDCAKKLLKDDNLSIADIAQTVGFANQGHLNYHFKRLVGITPRKFKLQ